MNRIIIVLVAIIAAMGGYIAYEQFVDKDSNAADTNNAADESPEDNLVNVNASISDSIVVNNSEWGAVQVVAGSYTGTTVTYEAVPAEGCTFVAWLDSHNNFIEMSSRIVSSKLDPKGTTAEFTDSVTGNNRIVSYSWQMPTFQTDSKGNMIYEEMQYPCFVSEADFYTYHNDDVHRKAVLGNVYLTPWELVVSDPAVQDAVQYLKPYTDGLSNIKKAWVVMAFVQDVITYQTDSAQYGQSEYWAYPIETMYSGKGDCEDTAILFCAIGSQLGLDTGLVSFSYTDTERRSLGHMGAAFALQGTESVTAENDPCFVYKGVTYCYVETACDSRFDLGYLLKYPDVDAYRIHDGGFTHITYENGIYGHEVLVAIGANYDTSKLPVYGFDADDEVYYGDDFTNPPTINMSIGDMFSYIPQTNLPCTFTASGSGLAANGGPFQFDPETYELHGKALEEGSYDVVIKAETTGLEVYQVAYQYIHFEIGESDMPNYGGVAKTLNFTNGTWNVVSQEIPNNSTSEPSSESQDDMWQYILVGVLVVAVGLIAIRVFL